MAHEGLVHLRRAVPDDAAGIAAVHVGTWQQAYRGLVPDALLDSLDQDARKTWWAREIELTGSEQRPWVAECGSRVVGFVSAGASRDDGAPSGTSEVYAIYVDPACWSMGVGRDLLVRAEHDLRARGFHSATLWVLATNARARRFYEMAGWQPDGASRDEVWADHHLDEVRYQRKLA